MSTNHFIMQSNKIHRYPFIDKENSITLFRTGMTTLDINVRLKLKVIIVNMVEKTG